ncbi:MAG: L,D-transpeptidase family protein [Clostridia bacterium]|nr:L,D-transpeptidase family protein [Clostridia bacterium]
MKDNTIYVKVQEGSLAILEFPEHNIKTRAYIGKKGASEIKKEGNEMTPLGTFDLGIALGTHSNEEMQNKLTIDYKQITDDMYWVDDSNSKYYNQLVDIKDTKKDWDSAEHLIDFPTEYEYLVEIKTNPNNVPGKGSAIFLHCTQNEPTLGCVGIDRITMEKLIQLIDNTTKISILK